MGFLKKIFGSHSDHELKRLYPLADKIDALSDEYAALTDEQLRAKTDEFKQRYAEGASLDDLLPEAFATAREASWRVLGMKPFRVQLIGGIVLHQGRIAEMKTGEGKTLVAVLPAYLNALTGEGVHIVTVNDYLASYQAELMGRVYRFLGMSTGCIITNQKPPERRKQYNADITYGTNNEFGFDYLRDNMAWEKADLVQRGHHYAIVDEVDSILIDEARTPLIISGPAEGDVTRWYRQFAKLVLKLTRDEDYDVDEKKKVVGILDPGITKVEDFLGIDNLYEPNNTALIGYLNNAIKAKELFLRDKDYVVTQGEVLIVDEHTGRILPGRRYNEGLHQAIEAKELVALSQETRAMASITYQSLFKKFKKISGMTGTGKVAEKEFLDTYGMKVIQIPTNRKKQRIDYPDKIYATLPEKVFASLEYVKHYHEKDNPILIFVGSVEMSELYSSLLLREGIAHNLLNANNAPREAEMIAESGQMGAVTVATSMAGRGTDIKLGKGVAELGGLVVIGTERMESQRIDLQIRGRSGRQGDPGMSKFFVSLEDDVIKKYGPSWVHRTYKEYAISDHIEPKELTGRKYRKLVEKAQEASESSGRTSRRQTLEFAESMNIQREMIYAQRDRLIYHNQGLDTVIDEVLDDFIDQAMAEEDFSKAENLYHFILRNISFRINEIPKDLDLNNREQVLELIYQFAYRELDAKKQELKTKELNEYFQRLSMLKAVDDNWVEQVDYLQQLQMAIGSQQLSQKNPIVEYYQEAYKGFEAMKRQIRKDMVRNLLLSQVQVTKKGDIISHFP